MSITTFVPLSDIDALARRLPSPATVDVTIEVIGEAVGDQVEVQKLPWHALIYDDVRNVVEVSVGGRGQAVPIVLRHEIHYPVRIGIEEEAGVVRVVSIEARGGVQTLVRFHERPAISAGAGGGG